MRINAYKTSNQSGISLIELIIFIVIISISFTAISLVYVSTTRSGSDPLIRIKSVELAQIMMNEILLKKYDEVSPAGGGCVDTSAVAGSTRCPSGPTAEPFLDDAETNRTSFDDVDDYHNQLYCGDNVLAENTACPALTCQDLVDESGADITALYAGFSVCTIVTSTGGVGTEISNFDFGEAVLAADAKRIDVLVTDSVKSKISLTAYSLNY